MYFRKFLLLFLVSILNITYADSNIHEEIEKLKKEKKSIQILCITLFDVGKNTGKSFCK